MRFRTTCSVLTLAIAASGCSSSLDRVLAEYGYTSLRPPSTLYAPGTLVSVTNDRPLEAAIICSPGESLGASLAANSSPTETTDLSKKISTTFALGADEMKQLQANAKLRVVESVRMTLSNPVVLEVDDTDVISNLGKRDRACAEAVAARQKAGSPVSMIRSALKADVLYEVSLDDSAGLDAAAQAEITKGVAVHLGVAHAETSTTTIKGTGLFWGVINDSYLAHLNQE